MDNFEPTKKLPKFPVEQCWQIEIGMLGKQLLKQLENGELKSGLAWTTDSYGVMAVNWQVVLTNRPFVLLTFVKNNSFRVQIFGIEAQEIKFGNKLYFQCACGRRCLKLYNRPRYYGFGCRLCQDLFYEITRIKKRRGFSGLAYYINRKLKIQSMKLRVRRVIYGEHRTRRAESLIRAIQKWKLPESLIVEFQKI